MGTIFLFDWGNTLMVDFPDVQGKMCDWPKIELVKGARETLDRLSQEHFIYVVTSAEDSDVNDIERAFERAGVAQYIEGYFCKANLGVDKGHPDFYPSIVRRLKVPVKYLIMVEDTYDKDILPAMNAGIKAIWFNPAQLPQIYPYQITALSELCEMRCAVSE